MAQVERHLVVGASGALGASLTRLLLSERKRIVAAFVRDPERLGRLFPDKPPFILPGDARDANALRQAALGCSTIYYCARRQVNSPNWERDTLGMASLVIEAAIASGARLVIPAGLAIYGEAPEAEGTITESQAPCPRTRRGRLEAEIEGMLQAAFARGDLTYSLLRTPDLYGPGVRRGMVAGIARRLLAGRAPMWVGPPDVAQEWVLVSDAARALAMLGEAPRELVAGRSFHLPGPVVKTPREWLALWCERAERPVALLSPSRARLALMRLFSPVLDDWLQHAHLHSAPYLLCGRAFKDTFGFLPATGYEEGISQTLAWARKPPIR